MLSIHSRSAIERTLAQQGSRCDLVSPYPTSTNLLSVAPVNLRLLLVRSRMAKFMSRTATSTPVAESLDCGSVAGA